MIDEYWLYDKTYESKIIQYIEELINFHVQESVKLLFVSQGQMTGTVENHILMASEWGDHYLNEMYQKADMMLRKCKREVKDIFAEALGEEFKVDNEKLKEAGYDPFKELSPRMKDVFNAAYQQTNGTLENITRTSITDTYHGLRQELDKAYFRVRDGGESYNSAIKDVVEKVSSDGLYQVKYSGNKRKKDRIEVAARKALLTGMNQSTIRLTLAYAEEIGHNQFLVTQHYGARTRVIKYPYESHFSWQGKAYDLSSLQTICGWGSGGGLGGWNCRHHVMLFFPGMKIPEPIDEEENRKLEELNERQREYERRIRKTKQQIIGIRSAIDETKDDKLKLELEILYERKARLLKRQSNDYKKFNDENGLKNQNERIQVAQWNRSQAAKASAAARSK